jgi:serine/threonine protein kinase
MGEVYEAEDLELATTVALKTLDAKFAQDVEMLARFRRETLLARKVNHPNVCRMYDIGRHRHPALGDILFLTMEYLSGETLRMHLLRSGRFHPAEALSLVRQMSSGLQAAHDVGVVHRDFKASNVMLIASDRGLCAKITDFGLARSLAILVDEITVQGMIIGTPSAMAPEQFRGISSPASDIYSLGVVMREMVTASGPTTRPHSDQGLVRNEKATLADVDPLWRAAISKCLAQEPSERFARADQVPAALVKSAHARRPTGFRRYAALSAFAVAMLLVAIWVFRDSIGHLLGF